MDWSARCLFHARTAVTTLVPLERGHGGISRICGGVQFLEEDEAKVTRASSGWLKLITWACSSGEITVLRVVGWSKCGVEPASMGDRSEPDSCARGVREWEAGHGHGISLIPLSRRARRVAQHRNRHVSRGHRVQLSNCQLHLPCWAWIGQGRPRADRCWRCWVNIRATT